MCCDMNLSGKTKTSSHGHLAAIGTCRSCVLILDGKRDRTSSLPKSGSVRIIKIRGAGDCHTVIGNTLDLVKLLGNSGLEAHPRLVLRDAVLLGNGILDGGRDAIFRVSPVPV